MEKSVSGRCLSLSEESIILKIYIYIRVCTYVGHHHHTKKNKEERDTDYEIECIFFEILTYRRIDL